MPPVLNDVDNFDTTLNFTPLSRSTTQRALLLRDGFTLCETSQMLSKGGLMAGLITASFPNSVEKNENGS